MRIIYILILCAICSTVLLWLGLFGRLQRRLAALGAAVSLSIGGGLLLLAVLPGNSFYGTVITQAVPPADTPQKLIALTFDDGPYPPYTQQLLQVLKSKQAPATFFMVGENAAVQPDLVRQVQQQGHEIALHAGYHRDFLKLGRMEADANIAYGKHTLESITGSRLLYMRPPHGFKDWQTMDTIQQAGLQAVNWSIIPRDWTNPGAEIIAQRVCEAAYPGAIILLHDGDSPKNAASREQTIVAAALIIDQLRSQGYEFVTVQQLLEKYNSN